MSFFSRLIPRAPVFDLFEGHPDGWQARVFARDGHWGALARLCSDMEPQARAHLIRGLGAAWPLDEALPSGLDKPGLNAVLGGMHVVLGWRARGTGRGPEIEPEKRRQVHLHLSEAERLLTLAADENPGDPVIWGDLIRANMGLGGSRDIARSRHSMLRRCTASCPAAELSWITYNQAKWFGSQDQMWDAIDEATMRTPSSGWHGLRARGHVEDWLWHTRDAGDPRAADRHRQMVSAPGHIATLERLDDLFWEQAWSEGPADDMPFDPDRQFAHNQFAALWHVTGRFGRAALHVEAIGAHPMEWPFRLLSGDPDLMDGWNALRLRCGLSKLRN